MATLQIDEVRPAARAAADRGYWLFDRRADLGWFWLTVPAVFAFYLPAYGAFGSAAVWPLYVLYVAGFATPHTWLTYAVTVTPSGRPFYTRRSFWGPVALAAAFAALIPLTYRWGGWDLLWTAILIVGYYHVAKQHLGILRLYDVRYASVFGDRSIFAAMAPFHRLCQVLFCLPLAWTWTLPGFQVGIGIQRFVPLHPLVPLWVLGLALVPIAWYGGRTAHTLLARRRQGQPFPVAHLALALAALATYMVAYAAIPPRDYLLTLAIFITYHDLQYAGFVWNFQRRRGEAEAPLGTPLDVIHRWALERRAWPYFGVAFLFSAVLLAVVAVVPPLASATLLIFHNTLHYFMDGTIWQRKHNAQVQAHLQVQRS